MVRERLEEMEADGRGGDRRRRRRRCGRDESWERERKRRGEERRTKREVSERFVRPWTSVDVDVDARL